MYEISFPKMTNTVLSSEPVTYFDQTCIDTLLGERVKS